MTKTITSNKRDQKKIKETKAAKKLQQNQDMSRKKLSDCISTFKTSDENKTLGGGQNKKGKRFRSRKDFDQMVILNKMFKQDPTWSRTTVQYLKAKLGLKTSQIYKWGYDRKKIAENEEKLQLDNSNSLNLSTQDSYLTDSGIKDYNNAVDQIGDTALISDKFGHQQNTQIAQISDIHNSFSRDNSNNFPSKVRSEKYPKKSEIRTSIDADGSCAIVHSCGCRSYGYSQVSSGLFDKPSTINQVATVNKHEKLAYSNISLGQPAQTFIFEYDDNLMDEQQLVRPIEISENAEYMDCFNQIPVQMPLIRIEDDFSPSIDFDIG